jgi:NAD(P)-dependent dehydrogenase (short-subunit alcohol dehydrogenase family)
MTETKIAVPTSNAPYVAVITGAAQGIGKRTAEVLAAKGFNLVLNDLRQPDQTISNLGNAQSLVVLGDISSEAVVQTMLEQTLAKFGRADVLVNNAGISFIKPAEDITLHEWQQVINVNLTAPFLLCREFGKHMLARGSGSIVNIASVAGLLAVSDRSAYNASKHGLIGLTKTLAAEWGGRGVRVNAVCPGWVLTEMDHKDTGVGTYSHADIEGRVPMGRYASPDDIAQAVAFLADSTQSGFINGHNLSVDGGWASDGSWESLRLKKR